jgi:hypothetical protein
MEPKHEKSFVDYDRTYETNLIGLRGIIYFGIGLFLLIVITFGLMFFLQNVMEDQAVEAKDKRNVNPMMMTERERLPPEPRLQLAPGYGVESEQGGRVNLELRAPQSEYWELERQWERQWADGQRDPKTGTVITLPIDEAKAKLLQESAQAPVSEQSQNSLEESRRLPSYSSVGRTASDVRR